jgi:uncharacterized surface protein with fasciclin (FAS1) repeats
MNQISIKITKLSIAVVFSIVLLVSCNKVYEPVVPEVVYNPGDAANTVAKKIEATSTYSIFTAALKRTGLYTVLDQANASFTVFAPNDAAFTASGLSLAIVNAMPLSDLTSAIQHHIIPNEKISAALIASTVPNTEKKSALNITTVAFVASIPTTAIPIKMSVFLSKRATGAWLNNIPIVATDVITGSNGVVHTMAAVVAPPTRVLWDTLNRDPEYAYFVAAVQRGDSGYIATSSSNLQNAALSQPFASLTVFAPTNTAFQTLLTGAITQALVAQGMPLATAQATATALASSPTVFSNPALYSVLTAQLVRGIVVYHIMGQRFFSVNFSSTATNYPTLLNGAIPAHPGLSISSTLVSNFGAALSVKGAANATAASAIATATGVDRPTVNGNLYKIDQVLLPQ